MKKIFGFFILQLFLNNVNAQSTYIGGLFPTIDHSGTLTKKLDYSLYYFGAFPLLNFKNPDFSNDADFLLFYSEQAITCNLSEKFSLTGSYVFQRSNVVKNNFENENRLYAQATYKHSLKNVNLKHRLRFDARFIHNRVTDETPFTHRLRYLIGIDFPIKSKKDNLYFTAYEEVFFNTFKNAGSFYGENWATAALGVKLNPANKIEAGLLYITWNINPHIWFNQYYLQLTWITHIDLRKNKE